MNLDKKNQNEDDLTTVAMEIILHAGDARLKKDKAIEYSKEGDFQQADELIAEAREDIRQAHLAQTNIIQNETAGRHYELTLLFNHAQDTLMTIMSEVKTAVEIINLYKLIKNITEK